MQWLGLIRTTLVQILLDCDPKHDSNRERGTQMNLNETIVEVKSEQARSYAGVLVEVFLDGGSHRSLHLGTCRRVKTCLQTRLCIDGEAHQGHCHQNQDASDHRRSVQNTAMSIARRAVYVYI